MARPEAVRISASEGEFRGRVSRAMFLGSIAEYLVELPKLGDCLVDVPNPTELGLFDVGQEIYISLSPESVHVLPEKYRE